MSTSLSDARSRLGLPDDADQDAVIAAAMAELDKQSQPTDPKPADPAPAPTAERQPEPVAASTGNDEALKAMRAELSRVSAELADRNKREAAQVKASVFDNAVKTGKIAPADRQSWEARYDRAPEVITDVLASISAGTAVPVSPAGVVGSAEPDATGADVPDDIAGLFSTPFSSKEA